METVDDITREMRKNGVCYDVRHWYELCGRLEDAYKRELIDKYSGVVNEREKEIERLRDALKDCTFQLNAWVLGGRFAITESDKSAIRKAYTILSREEEESNGDR